MPQCIACLKMRGAMIHNMHRMLSMEMCCTCGSVMTLHVHLSMSGHAQAALSTSCC